MEIIRSLGVTTLVTLLSADRTTRQCRNEIAGRPEHPAARAAEETGPECDSPEPRYATRPRPSCN